MSNYVSSFDIDHTKLKPGVYLSRLDIHQRVQVSTFDVRLCRPYHDYTMTDVQLHSIEHILATLVRKNCASSDTFKPIGIFPMGCATGFYLVFFGNPTPQSVANLVRTCFEEALTLTEMPGNSMIECGNKVTLSLNIAQASIRYFLHNFDSFEYSYPQ